MSLKEKLKNAFTPKAIYRQQKQIEAQEQIINSLNERINYDGDHSIKRECWSDFQWLVIYGNYFANRFKYDTCNNKLNIFLSQAIRQAYMFGNIGVWNNAGLPTLCYIFENDITKPYMIINLNINWNEVENVQNLPNNLIKVSRNDVIIYTFDNYALPALYWLKPLIEWEKQQDKTFANEQVVLPTRLLQRSKANVSKVLAEKFCRNKSPVIYQGENNATSFEPLALDTNIMEVIEQDKYERNRYYMLLGIRTNLERKNERNVSDEVEQNDLWFSILENERYLHLKQFLVHFSNQFKVEVYLENEYGEMEIVNGY